MTTVTPTTSPETIVEQYGDLTRAQRSRLAQAWRMQIGGGAAVRRARGIAIAHHRDDILAELRAATAAVNEMSGEFGGGDRWTDAQARQCVAETCLALAITDLDLDAVERRAVEILLAPWSSVVGL